MKKNKRLIIILFFIILSAVLNCSAPMGKNTSTVTIDIGLNELKNSKVKDLVPSDITFITLTVEGEGMSRIEKSVDIKTGVITLDVPSGKNRVFSLYVQSALDSYTGQATADLLPGEVVTLIIDMGKLTFVVSSIAGSPSSKDGIGTAASFFSPAGITTDGTNLYVADTDNDTIRQIVISTGAVTTFAGGGSGSPDGTGTAASFSNPEGITTDGTNLYVADKFNNTIRQIVISTGVVTTLAGTAGITGSADGTGSAASFHYPAGITTDGTNLYVTDQSNSTIRQIVISTGVVTTLAGTAGIDGSADGTGSAASFWSPEGITTDGTNLFVTDSVDCTIRQIVISTGVVTTLAGDGMSGHADGTGTAASFDNPTGITTDGTNLFITDSDNHAIRQIVISTGVVTTLAGTAGIAGSSDGTGIAASFDNPQGIITYDTNLYVTDTINCTIRQIAISTAAVTTLAGSIGYADGIGAVSSFKRPTGITTDGANLYVADQYNYTIRQIVISTGVVTTIAGTAGINDYADGTGSAALFDYPTGITTDGTNLYVTDECTIRHIVISTGVVTTLAGTAYSSGSADGTGSAASFGLLAGITTDGTNLYVADQSNSTIRQIVISTGVVTTIAGTAGSYGSADGTGSAASFYYPAGITTDGTNLYVADTFNSTIRQIVISTGVVTTIAGTPGIAGSSDGTGSAASFSLPYGITTDGTNLYVADTNNTIRKIVISTGVVTTLAGTAGITGSADGTGSAASFYSPYGIAVYGTDIYVADTENDTIRQISW